MTVKLANFIVNRIWMRKRGQGEIRSCFQASDENTVMGTACTDANDFDENTLNRSS
jgi:hypothetical protein